MLQIDTTTIAHEPDNTMTSDSGMTTETIDDGAREVLVLVNPKAGSKSRESLVEALKTELLDRSFHTELISDIDFLAARAKELHRSGELRAVVSAGGDGTAGLITNRTESGIPLAILPLGTENLLARYLGVTAHPGAIADRIARGLTVRLDAGKADDRIFLLMAGCGFDADVVRRLDRGRKGHIHHLSWAKPILDSIRRYQYPEVRVYCALSDQREGTPIESPISCRWAFVINLPKYAGGLSIMPDAIATDGMLDLCTFKEGSLLNGLRYLSGVVLGQHRFWNDCISGQITKVRLESNDEVPYQLDGDPGGFLPVDIEVLPQRLRLIVDEAWVAEKKSGAG